MTSSPGNGGSGVPSHDPRRARSVLSVMGGASEVRPTLIRPAVDAEVPQDGGLP
jgi:hypothetical protein